MYDTIINQVSLVKSVVKPITFALVAVVCAAWVMTYQFMPTASAAKLTTRRLLVGTSEPSANTSHDFSFTIGTNGNVGSISFLYCTNTPFQNDSCDAPAGLDLTGASLDSQSGEVGFSIDGASTANNIILSRVVSSASQSAVAYGFSGVVNPSLINSSIFVRILTYSSTDATGPATDFGAVVFSTSGDLTIGVFVPPRLIFCVGATVSLDCSSSTGAYLKLGELSAGSTNYGTSQFSVSTNSPTGYSVFLAGTTLTSGNNTIAAIPSPSISTPGVSQFGLNLRANTSPVVGEDKSGSFCSVAAGYNTINKFVFSSGQMISSCPVPTDFEKYTASYIVNIDAAQRPGVYTTTIQYIASAMF